MLLILVHALAFNAVAIAQTSIASNTRNTSKPSATLDAARNRGTLIVGIKTDYPPFGQLNVKGEAEGLEHDLAEDIASRLGVGLVKVSVTGANRLQKLEEGAVDVVLATMGDTADRRRIATLIEPNYYSSGVTLLMRPEQKATDWPDIRGLKVCAIQGSYFNRPMSQRYLLDLVIFNNARDAKLALRDGQCKGYLFDNTAIQSDLAKPEWAGYKAPLPPAMVAPWAIAVAKRDQGTERRQQDGQGKKSSEHEIPSIRIPSIRTGKLRAAILSGKCFSRQLSLNRAWVWFRRHCAAPACVPSSRPTRR